MVHRVASTSFQRNTHLHLTARDKVRLWQILSVVNGKEREGRLARKKDKGGWTEAANYLWANIK